MNKIKKSKEGTNSETIYQQNRLLVLRQIKAKRTTSRIAVAKSTGLKQATITNIVNELIDIDYVKEIGLIEGENGRRVTGIEINEDKFRVISVRLTDEYFAVGVYNVFGDCVEVEKEFQNTNQEFLQVLDKISIQVKKYIDKNEKRKILGLGIVVNGLSLDIVESYLTKNTPTGKTYVQEYFTNKFNLYVCVEKSSNMAGYYEWEKKERKSEKLDTLLCIMVGYSVDSAIISNGRIVRGRDVISGDLGHMSINCEGPLCECGNRGCINQYISVSAIKKLVGRLKSQYPNSYLSEKSNIRDIVKAYENNDLLANMVYEEIAHYLSIVVANQINYLDPTAIIIGDEIPNNAHFLESLKSNVSKLISEKKMRGLTFEFFKEIRMTKNDVSLKGISRYIIRRQFSEMKIK